MTNWLALKKSISKSPILASLREDLGDLFAKNTDISKPRLIIEERMITFEAIFSGEIDQPDANFHQFFKGFLYRTRQNNTPTLEELSEVHFLSMNALENHTLDNLIAVYSSVTIPDYYKFLEILEPKISQLIK